MSKPRVYVAPTVQYVVTDEVHHHIHDAVLAASLREATSREAQCRRLLTKRLPRTGPWLADHPRALKFLFRLRPSLRPTLTIVQITTADDIA